MMEYLTDQRFYSQRNGKPTKDFERSDLCVERTRVASVQRTAVHRDVSRETSYGCKFRDLGKG